MPSHSILFDLTQRYCEPHRHYHGIRHIAWMLHEGRAVNLSEEQVLGIWFHDAIYDPQSSTNEADSARLARELLTSCRFGESRIALVEQIVLDTTEHEPTVPESAAVIDLDLASLAAERTVFEANTERLRREYAHLTDEEFDRGRAAFLRRFLERDQIFWTEWGAAREPAARANLERDLEQLG